MSIKIVIVKFVRWFRGDFWDPRLGSPPHQPGFCCHNEYRGISLYHGMHLKDAIARCEKMNSEEIKAMEATA